MSRIDYETLRQKLKEEPQIKNNEQPTEENYWNSLSSDYARFKADVNNDRIITFDEYRDYVLGINDTVPNNAINVPPQNKHENYYSTHHYYHLDYTFIIGILIICFTAVLISFITRK